MDFSSSIYKPPISEPSEREHMFEKVVTPSDVGKLNRLVIPKQHAEKYFPLDSAAGEKGLLLNFDESAGTGKSWRFRYSYWSSSQSYVITKGWSRFVKDKQLFAGDVVSFLRDSGDGRLFIDWRRRPADSRTQLHHGISLHRPINHPHHLPSWYYNSSLSVTPAPPPLLVGPGPYNYGYGVISPNYSCLHNQFGAGAGPTLFETVPLAKEKASPKRLRLFGVNMDCHVTSKDQRHKSDVVLPSYSSAALQLRLHGGDPNSSAASKINLVTTNFLDKGKSSLSLDFGV